MQAKIDPTCIDCDYAFELLEDAGTVICSAHLEYRDAQHPASCSAYTPRRVSGIAEDGRDAEGED